MHNDVDVMLYCAGLIHLFVPRCTPSITKNALLIMTCNRAMDYHRKRTVRLLQLPEKIGCSMYVCMFCRLATWLKTKNFGVPYRGNSLLKKIGE